MIKTLTTLLFWVVATLPLAAQTKPYTTSSGELIFSGSTWDGDGAVRFSPVINMQNLINFDKSESFGWFTGLNLRNVGFIYDESDAVRKKVRTYNLGVPVGVKVGKLDGKFIYFVERREASSTSDELWRVASAGGEPQKVMAFDQEIVNPSIHPSGRYLAFASQRRGDERDVRRRGRRSVAGAAR